MMAYTISIEELLKRPIIRNDFDQEWMNKMTDEELSQFDKESYELCLKEGTAEKYPDINAACLSKHIDRGILYSLLKQEWEENMLENNSYWELDILFERKLELRRLKRSLWSKIWNWRKIARIEKQLKYTDNENQDKK